MKCLYMVLFTLVMMVIRRLVFHPLFRVVLISGSYFVCLCVRVCSRNLSWQYLNLSLYSLIGDFFMILRLLKDMVFKYKTRKTQIYIQCDIIK